MTDEQKQHARALREFGYTYQRIANKYGVSRQYVWQILHPSTREKKRRGCKVKWIYPRAVEWMDEHDVTARDMEQAMGVAPGTLSHVMNGRDASERTILKLLTLTGMTYEELFSTSEGGESNV